MTIDAWLDGAVGDAVRRGLPQLAPLLETLARATTALREAKFCQSPVVGHQSSDDSRESSAGSPQS